LTSTDRRNKKEKKITKIIKKKQIITRTILKKKIHIWIFL